MAGETTRQRYLNAVVEHMLAKGRTDLPLVSLATAAGTSDRMLVYYFKTREGLVTECLDAIRANRHRQLALGLARVTRATEVTPALVEVLSWMASPNDAAAVRLFYDAGGQGFRNEEPFASFLRASLSDFNSEATLAARRLGADETHAEVFGTMFTALGHALACDLLAMGDSARVDRTVEAAAQALVDTLDLP